MMTLSPSFFPVSRLVVKFLQAEPFAVGEDEEVSIKQLADSIVKAMDFHGEYTVSAPYLLQDNA